MAREAHRAEREIRLSQDEKPSVKVEFLSMTNLGREHTKCTSRSDNDLNTMEHNAAFSLCLFLVVQNEHY